MVLCNNAELVNPAKPDLVESENIRPKGQNSGMASRGLEEAAELMLCVRDVILPLAKLAGTGHRRHGTLRTDVGRADVGIKSRRNGRRSSGVCQTPATAKKKKPDGIPRNGRKGQNPGRAWIRDA